MTCEICVVEEGKYCCPGCGRRTCSVKCVREHKIKFGCSGLRPVPTAPERYVGGAKYNEEMFVKDYAFLEEVNAYADQTERKIIPEDSARKTKSAEFKKIQRMAKLAELRLLPSTFTRSKQNRTHVISERESIESKEDQDEVVLEELPEKKSARLGRIAWTVDLVDFEGGRLLDTLFEVSDETEFRSLLHKRTSRAFLRNETRNQGVEKWREIPVGMWGKSLGQVLVGGRFFEYPQIGLEQDGLEKETQ